MLSTERVECGIIVVMSFRPNISTIYTIQLILGLFYLEITISYYDILLFYQFVSSSIAEYHRYIVIRLFDHNGAERRYVMNN